MAGRIDYDIEKYQFTEAGETPRLREQWREVYLECRQLRAGAEERLRIALLNVDYVTSFELPFRLLLVRAPQLSPMFARRCSLAVKPPFSTANVTAASIV